MRNSASSAWHYQSCFEGFECTLCLGPHSTNWSLFSWWEQKVSYLVIFGILSFLFFPVFKRRNRSHANASGLCSCLNVSIFIYYFSILNSFTTVSVRWQSNKCRAICTVVHLLCMFATLRNLYNVKLCAAAIAFFFTFCVYGIMITREISIFLHDTTVLLVMAGRGVFVYNVVSSLFPVSCSLPVSCYLIFCFLVSSRCFNKLPAVRSCTAAGAKILVKQRTFCHSSLVIFDALYQLCLFNCVRVVFTWCCVIVRNGTSHLYSCRRACEKWLCLQPDFVACAFGEPSSSRGVLKPCVNVYVCDIAETSLSKRTETIVPYSACSVLCKSSDV